MDDIEWTFFEKRDKNVPFSKGIYMFKVASAESERILYIGRSKKIRQRIIGHMHLLSILEKELREGETLLLAYFICENYAEIEKRLIDKYRPKYNSHFNLSRPPLRYYACLYDKK